ncbi:hypothetical protein [Rickettsia sp.]
MSFPPPFMSFLYPSMSFPRKRESFVVIPRLDRGIQLKILKLLIL